MVEYLGGHLAESALSSGFLVGRCPMCGNLTAHDCKASHYVLNDHILPKEIVKEKSRCQVALEIDDISVGHCDHCDYLWCLECLTQLNVDEGVCLHWEVCAVCNEERGSNKGEEGDNAHDVECPYRDKFECPKIRSMKSENNSEK